MRLSDNEIVTALREASIPPPPADLVRRIKRKRRPIPWLISLAGTTIAGVGVLLSLSPTPSLAQVEASQVGVREFTVIEHRQIYSGVTEETVYARDGDRWSECGYDQFGALDSQKIMDKVELVEVTRTPDWRWIEVLDRPREMAFQDAADFEVKNFFPIGTPVKSHYEGGLLARGVEVFEANTTDTARGQRHTETEEVIADRPSHLPLRMKLRRDGGRSGFSWQFEYGMPDPLSFRLRQGQFMEVHDNRVDREAAERAHQTGPVLMIGRPGNGVLLFPKGFKVGPLGLPGCPGAAFIPIGKNRMASPTWEIGILDYPAFQISGPRVVRNHLRKQLLMAVHGDKVKLTVDGRAQEVSVLHVWDPMAVVPDR